LISVQYAILKDMKQCQLKQTLIEDLEKIL